MSYKTKQRDFLLDIIDSFEDRPFTAEHLMSVSDISKATIYRSLEVFEKEGLLRKYYVDPQEGALYQATLQVEHCDDHFHCVCYKCGHLFHVDCHEYDEMTSHFNDDHGFKIDFNRTILYGICEVCQA